ncbi:MAG TPA: glycosyltransferase [Trueperaceae bacterium]|nr:glycosyltransferase [Trueperaceae bacterium]
MKPEARAESRTEPDTEPGRPSGRELGIVVVHHRTPGPLFDALWRIGAAAPDAAVVLVDTAPDAEVLTAAARIVPGLITVSTANHSYSHAVNRGWEELAPLAPRYLAQMNADVMVEPDTFARLTEALSAANGAGVAGPLALTPAGKPQDLGPLYALEYRRLRRSSRGSVKVRWLSGCLQLVDRAVIDAVGGYDTEYRFTNEDMEFCLRAAEAGFASLLVDTAVVHLGGTSTPKHPAFHVEGRRGGYLLSAKYLPSAVSFLHRGFLRTEAALGSALARDPVAKVGHQRMARLIRDGAWHRSPFGATLDDR